MTELNTGLMAGNENNSKKTVNAVKINSASPFIDGKLNESCWKNTSIMSEFTQKDPMEGSAAFNKVEIHYIYDDNALYIGARMFKDSPDDIVATVSRRDNVGNSERIIISIDSYNDKRTAYTFGLTSSAVRFDYYHSSDSEHDRDYSFNPVWTGKTNIDEKGWTAEIKIPFSQLRFNDIDKQVWGVNVNWWAPNKREDSYWILVPKNETGWSSRMGDLTGIEGIKPSSRIELTPYIAADALINTHYDKDNPFENETDLNSRIGLDFKMGLGPNYTLDATINPDFGQVEADPAEVNLSAFETTFSEKRPFFTEGRKLIQGSGPQYFYSRRIGAKPMGNPDPNAFSSYIRTPDHSQILGATKISGRSQSGLSIGGLAALTAEEYSKLYFSGSDSTAELISAPMTGFAVARAQQEFGENTSTVGFMLTGIKRDIKEGSLLESQLSKNAVSGGSDWNIRFNEGEYVLAGHLGFSHVRGSKEAILAYQQRSSRYFQRPDAGHVSIDSNSTNISGMAGAIRFNKNTGTNWLWGASYSFETPGLELNDMGRLHSADDMDINANLTYRDNVPGDYFHKFRFNLSAFNQLNFDGVSLRKGSNLNTNFTFLDRSSFHINFWHNFEGLSDDLTRGGPIMGVYSHSGMNTGYNSDWTKNLRWNFNVNLNKSPSGAYQIATNGQISFRDGGRLELSFSPRYDKIISTRQYIASLDNGKEENYGKRYIFSSIERQTISSKFRLTYAFSPDLTLEIYAEPFASSGSYYDYGEMEKVENKDLILYGENNTQLTKHEDGSYTVNDDGTEFDIDNHDFNYLSFRSNLVLRWEWMPGSTFFLVWQQNRAAYDTISSPVNMASYFDTFSSDGTNSLAIKVSYWFPVD
jgi:hypothetical protein